MTGPGEPGWHPPELSTEDVAASEARLLETSREHRLLGVEDLGKLAPPEALIEGLLYRSTLAQLSGAPGAYKTFLAVGMCASLAVGQNFEGRRVPAPCPVIYVAAEGVSGMLTRILAWCELTDVEPAELAGRLHVLPHPTRLGEQGDTEWTIRAIESTEAGLVVLDTRARMTLGLEENSATEQGYAIASCDAIIERTGASVLVIHHAGRQGGAGRGSTAWDGAVWTDLRVRETDVETERAVSVYVAKHKDAEDGGVHRFRLIPHTVSPDLMPDVPYGARSTLVAVAGDGVRPQEAANNQVIAGVARVVARHGAPNGLTLAEILRLLPAPRPHRATVDRAARALVARHVARIVPDRRPARYAPAGYVEDVLSNEPDF